MKHRPTERRREQPHTRVVRGALIDPFPSGGHMNLSSAQKLAILALVCIALPAALLAEDIPLANWAVPPYHASSASGGLTIMGDGNTGTAFVAYPPCRLVVPRDAAFPAGYGPPVLPAAVPRIFDITPQPNCPGIPAASA